MVGSGQNSNSSKLFMAVILTCKKEEDPIKNECTRVLMGSCGRIRPNFEFMQIHGCPCYLLVVGSSQFSNSSKLLWTSSLPAKKTKKIESKMRALDRSEFQIYPRFYGCFCKNEDQLKMKVLKNANKIYYDHNNHMAAICCI